MSDSIHEMLRRDAMISNQRPDAYAVINSAGEIEYSVSISKEAIDESTDWAKDLCHQHINEVAGIGCEPNVGQWVVRPVFIGHGPTTGERG